MQNAQTIYTTINHEGCTGCFNVNFDAGDDKLVIICNECGFVTKTVSIEP